MVRIITRRSSHLQKRKRIQLYNLKQLIQTTNKSSFSKNNNNNKNKNKSQKVSKSQQHQNNKSVIKCTIITRSNKLNQLILNTYNVKKEMHSSQMVKSTSKIPIITRSNKNNIIKNN